MAQLEVCLPMNVVQRFACWLIGLVKCAWCWWAEDDSVVDCFDCDVRMVGVACGVV